MKDIDDLYRLFERMTGEAPEPLAMPNGTERRVRNARVRRYATTTAVAIVVAAGIVLPIKAMLPLADGGRRTQQPAGVPTVPELPAFGPGQYVYSKVVNGFIAVQCEKGTIFARTSGESWHGHDGSGRDLGFATHYEGSDVCDANDSLASGPVDQTYPAGHFGPSDLSSLPTDPAALDAALRARSVPGGASPVNPPATPTPAGSDPMFGKLWRAIDDLLSTPDMSPRLQAALMEVAAGIDGVTVTEGTTDPAGRVARLIQFDSEGQFHRLYVDPDTWLLLAEENIDGAGRVLDTHQVLAYGITDSTDSRPDLDLLSPQVPTPTQTPASFPEAWLPLPPEWGDLKGQALADRLGLVAQPLDDLKGCSSVYTLTEGTAYCTEQLHYEGWQHMALGYLLRGESIDTPDIRERLLLARANDLETTDPGLAADIEWYLRKPDFQDEYDTWAKAPEITPAQGSEPTYVFSDFSLVYPFVPTGLLGGSGRGDTTGGTPDPGFATVSYRYGWSGDTYPGPASCLITFLGADGAPVGGEYLQDWGDWRPAGTSDGGTYPVTGEPVSAESVCSAGQPPSGRYTFEDPKVTTQVPNDSWEAALHGTVHTVGVVGRAGWHVCTATATAADGSSLTNGFALDVPDGWRLGGVSFPGTFVDAANLRIDCEPYTNQPGFDHLATESTDSQLAPGT